MENFFEKITSGGTDFLIDLIVSLLIAELTIISIENYNKSILYSLIPIVILVLL